MSKTPSTVFKTFLYAPRNFGIALATIMLLTAAGNALAAPAPKITSSKTATGQVGVAFSYQITANQAIPSGGWGTTVSIPGVSFSSATGAFSGTPTTAGPFSGNITATNAGGTGTKTLAVTINPPVPTVTSSGTASGTVGTAFSYQITANQAIPSGGWGTTVSIPGVSFSSVTGAFSGTPTTAGTFSGNITATNANGTGSKTLAVTISPPPHTFPTAIPAISPPALYAGDTVTLDASASDTNPPGRTLTYLWQQTAPASPNISLAPNNKAVIATFAAPAPPAGADSQLVTFKVKVTDKDAPTQQQNSESTPVSTTVYALPTANAGPDQAVDQGTTVYLNGSSSTGVSLTYAWTAPAGITLWILLWRIRRL